MIASKAGLMKSTTLLIAFPVESITSPTNVNAFLIPFARFSDVVASVSNLLFAMSVLSNDFESSVTHEAILATRSSNELPKPLGIIAFRAFVIILTTVTPMSTIDANPSKMVVTLANWSSFKINFLVKSSTP